MKKFLSIVLILGLIFIYGNVSAEIPPLVIDDHAPDCVHGEKATISGKVREHSTVKINGEDAEIKRKFRHTIYLDDAPSIKTVNVELTDKDGKITHSFNLLLKNIFRRKVGIYLGKKFIEVDGRTVELDVAPQLIDGCTMIPLEVLHGFEGFSITCAGNTCLLSLGVHHAVITMGLSRATVNTETLEMKAPPIMLENQLMVPITFIYKAFDFKGGEKLHEDFVIMQEIVPESDTPEEELPTGDVIALDNSYKRIINQTQFEIMGEIAAGMLVSVDSKKSNIYHQFDHKVSLLKAPSNTPIKIEVFDADGEMLETRTIDFENCDFLHMKVWIDKTEMEVNGEKTELDVPATILQDRTMIPFRAIGEALGAEISWISATRSIVFEYKDTKIELFIGNITVKVNGADKIIDAPATIINGRTVVPLRFIAETFDAEVEYDAKQRLVEISKVIHPERE